ncbi:hypothetical protein POV27_05660 [Aureisphaera galaxeae]|uniref:hypothetical protein n=1 Tax=Aureisphaera galaxeae TaxID=1538023 RepID=UPI0023506E1C|nr:hypothetical protein [Aureisphaera galaxeae]MDC8003527.1 hypothetical protein [Aureisphaera galaxeae]
MLQFIDRIKANRLFVFLYWATKISLGLGFVLSGIRKLPGVKFTAIGTDNPIGLFFEGMYQTGFYWNFIGYYQIAIGFLLITPWLKKLSPILAFPVTFNIFLVSASLHMRGTPVITSAMVLGNLFLMLWHSRSYLPLFQKSTP